MKDSISLIEYGLSTAQALTLIALAIVLFRNGHQKRFPAFTTYLYFSAVTSIAQLVLSRWLRPLGYFYFYWVIQVVVYALVFCVINEVFESLTERVRWLTQRGRKVLIRIAILTAIVAVAASLSPPQSRHPLMETITSLQRGLGLAIFSFMAVFVIFARIYSIEWYRQDAGIAAGMFLAYAFQSLWPSVNAYLHGYPEQRLYRVMVPLLEWIASLVWLYVFVRDGDGRNSKGPKVGLSIISGGKSATTFHIS